MMTQVFKVLYGSESLPLRAGNLSLPCYILEGGNSVFTKNGLQKALGYEGKSEDWLYDFLGSINKFYPIPGILFEAYEQPILFETEHSDGTSAQLSGIIPETLEMTCITIVNAKNDGYLSVAQLKHAKAAQILLNYALENNLHHDIGEATGFVFLKETGKKYLHQALMENNPDQAYQWIKTFPDVFFEKILSLHEMDWHDLRKNPNEVGSLLHEIVFSRLPEAQLETLKLETPKRSYKSKNKTAQNNEHAALKAYVAEVLSLLKAAGDNWPIFLQLLNRIHPKNTLPELRFNAFSEKKPAAENLTGLDVNLKKGLLLNRIYKKSK